MKITREELFHLAALSSLSLSDDEADALLKDVENIIKYISMLDELDVANVEPTYQVFEMDNVWRSDEIEPQSVSREDLLDLTTESKDHQIKVPKVL